MMAATKHTKPFYNTEIPSDWEVTELGKIAIVNMGQSPDSENYNEAGEGLPLIQGNADMQNRKSFKRYFTTQLTKVCDEGDLILSVRAPVGSIGEASFRSCIGRGVCAIKPDKVVKEYLYQLLLNCEDKWKKIEQGSTFTAVSSDDVRRFKLLVTKNQEEQKAIARVLSTADAAIHTTEKLIAQKELRKKWLMQQLLTGKKRLNGFSGEWKKLGAGEVFKSVTKKGFADEELLSATQDKGMIPRTMLEGRVTMPTTGTEGFKLVEIGDFVISLRSFQGGLEYSYYRGLVSPAYTVLKPKKSINEEFYKQYFKSHDFIGHLAIAVIGIRDGKQISYEDFCTVKIPYPSIEEQTAIAQVLQAADKEISLLKAKAEKLREQKKGLMQVLLTGKKRLLF
jgi:type I restriction enzyme S subunit